MSVYAGLDCGVATEPRGYGLRVRSKQACTNEQAGRMEPTAPTEYAILMGRGKSNLNHPGNKYFQKLIQSQQGRYFHPLTTKDGKRRIVMGIIQFLQSKGRFFFKRDPGSGEWVELAEEATREKVAHALQYRQRCSVLVQGRRGSAQTWNAEPTVDLEEYESTDQGTISWDHTKANSEPWVEEVCSMTRHEKSAETSAGTSLNWIINSSLAIHRSRVFDEPAIDFPCSVFDHDEGHPELNGQLGEQQLIEDDVLLKEEADLIEKIRASICPRLSKSPSMAEFPNEPAQSVGPSFWPVEQDSLTDPFSLDYDNATPRPQVVENYGGYREMLS